MLRCYLSFCLSLFKSHTTSPRGSVSEKATRDSHTHIPKTPTQDFRQILHGHSDRSFRLLERGIAHLQARDRHPLAPAELQSILEMEKQVDTPPGQQFLKPRSTLSSRWQTTTHCGALRGFTARCSNSGLISQKPPCSDICPGDLKEQLGNTGRHFLRITPRKSYLWTSLLYPPLPSRYFMCWSSFHMTEERSFTST